MPTLETPRLILRLPATADIDPLDEMDSDPEVMRYIGDGLVHPRTKTETAAIVAAAKRRWDERGYGWLSVTSRESGEFFGCGLERIVSIRQVDNVASHRVMDKLGLRFDHETVVPRSRQPVAVHALTRAEYDADLALEAGGVR